MYSWVCFFAVEEISYMLLFLCRGSSVIPRRQSQHYRTSHRRVLWYYWLIFALLCFPTGFKLQLSYLLSKNFILNRFHLYNPFGPAPLICLFNKIYIVPLMLECFFFFWVPKKHSNMTNISCLVLKIIYQGHCAPWTQINITYPYDKASCFVCHLLTF